MTRSARIRTGAGGGARSLAGLGRGEAATLGALVVAGWMLLDLAVFANGGRPVEALDLVPGSLVLMVAGALAGWLVLPRPRVLGAVVVASALVSLVPLLVDLGLTNERIWLARAVLACSVAAAIGSWAVARTPLGLARVGLSAGLLACLAKTVVRHGMLEVAWPLGLAALLGLAGGWLRPRGARAVTSLVAAAGAAAWLWSAIAPDLAPSRPDRPSGATTRSDGLAPDPDDHRRNLLLVVLDTVRADHLAPYGYRRRTTPRLDAFVERCATLYRNARSTSPWTLPSHTSLLTGRMASDAAPGLVLRADVPTLAERLERRGYRTAAVVANGANLRPRSGIDRGFQRYDDRHGSWVGDYLALAQLAGWSTDTGRRIYRDAGVVTDAALRWLAGDERGPFFLMLNYMDAHFPYLAPPPFDEAFAEEQPGRESTRAERASLAYDRELCFLDSQLGRLFDGLEALGLFEDTVIIVTSDHGESLGDRGFWLHGWNLYDELLRVPLYVKSAGQVRPRVAEEPIDGASVHALACRELRLDVPAASVARGPHAEEPGHGHPDRGAPVAEWFYNRRDVARWEAALEKELRHDLLAWVRDARKWIVSSTGEVEAYDLAADPGERHPLELDQAEAEAARARARRWWSAHGTRPAEAARERAGERLEAGEQVDQRLRALGYGGDQR